MLTTHKIASKYIWYFPSFANFCFVSCIRFENGKDTRYKVPLMGFLPQASFRLTAAGRGCTPSSGSKPSTPLAAAAAFAP
jgi:hypothetical protein